MPGGLELLVDIAAAAAVTGTLAVLAWNAPREWRRRRTREPEREPAECSWEDQA